MTRPIIIAHHLIWMAYGWWLPNDLRGSSSHTIACDIIAELGQLHHGRKKLQPCAADIRAFYDLAALALQHELLTFDEDQRNTIAAVFSQIVSAQTYTCYACAIMPDHIHLLIRKHKHQAEEMIENLQEASRLRLRMSGDRIPDHPIWGGPGWKVFLDYPNDVRRTIAYIKANPGKMGLAVQDWPFVQPYDGWPLHPGHNPNSPYAKRLRAVGRYPGQ